MHSTIILLLTGVVCFSLFLIPLIITEKQGLAKVGATINFIIKENKQNFELNKTAATKAGLNVGSNVEKLAANVFN